MKRQKINLQTASLLTAALIGLMSPTNAQNLGISATGSPPDNSALLDVDATGMNPKKGVLIPRMTTAERNAIPSPAQSLLIYNTTTKCFEFYENGMWQTFGCACTTPSTPNANAATNVTQSLFTANWSAVSGATTYYLDVNTNSSFTGTWILNNQNVGNGTSYIVTGLACGTTYYYRVRAANSCGTSANSNVISVTTIACGTYCDPQVWMTANMDVGTMINGSNEQNNNSVLEKYCYNNTPANCTTYGGLYQWAEAVGEPYSSNSNSVGGSWQTCNHCGSSGRQGICPVGYHIPTDLEWSRYEWCVENSIGPAGGMSFPDFQSNTGWRGAGSSPEGPGAKLKASSSNSPAWDGTNASGFTALPAGYRNSVGGGFSGLSWYSSFWSATEASATNAWSRYLNSGVWQSGRSNPNKTSGFSVRCLQN
jgi:uncharacterized protein (TIGR02145 family)